MSCIKKKVLPTLMAVVLTLGLCPALAFANPGDKLPPSEIAQSGSNFYPSGLKVEFAPAENDWLNAISEVMVDGVPYEKRAYSFSFNGSKDYLVWTDSTRYDNGYLLMAEDYSDDTATCVIKATGYEDLTLELNKADHSARIVSNSGGGDNGSGGSTDLKPAPVPTVNASLTYYNLLGLVFDDAAFVEGVTSVQCGEDAFGKQDYAISLNGKQYYLDSINNAICFASSGVFTSGDIITIKSAGYEDLCLQVQIGAGNSVTITPVDGDEDPQDAYELHARLVGSFESAIVGQEGYDAISGASTNVSVNQNSNAVVEVALTERDVEPTDADYKLLGESGIRVKGSECKVDISPEGSGMVGVYSTYDSSVTLAGTPKEAGSYAISVTVVDEQGRSATTNTLPFKVYSGSESLESQLVTENFAQTADGKYMWDMEPWAIVNFTDEDKDGTVTVPADLKAWYGSHASGTYGELGYAISEGAETTQTLVVPKDCNLTLVNMKVLSSVRVVVEDGAMLSLRDSSIHSIVDVQGGGTLSVNYDSYAGEWLTGTSINGQIIMRDGSTLDHAMIYSNTNNLANGNEARHNTSPVVVTEGNVNIVGDVFVRGDEAPTGTDPATGKSYAGQAGLEVNGTLTVPEGSTLAVYGGGDYATTSNGGVAVNLDNGTITGAGKLIAVGGNGFFGDGGAAVAGQGEISVADAYLHGGNSTMPGRGSAPGAALSEGVKLADTTNRNLVDGMENPADEDNVRWIGTTAPDISADNYPVDDNAPSKGDDGEDPVTPPVTPSKPANPSTPSKPTTPSQPSEPELPFPDLVGDEWYVISGVVDFLVDTGLIKGVDVGNDVREFQGDATMSRAMFATVLNRLAGEPAASVPASFADVASDAWYAGTVAWASEVGVVKGYGDGTCFGPDDDITREQMAVMMMRYAEFAGADTSVRAELSAFSDAGDLTFGEEAMQWAVASGLIKGYDGSDELGCASGATRAEVGAVLERFVELMSA